MTKIKKARNDENETAVHILDTHTH